MPEVPSHNPDRYYAVDDDAPLELGLTGSITTLDTSEERKPRGFQFGFAAAPHTVYVGGASRTRHNDLRRR